MSFPVILSLSLQKLIDTMLSRSPKAVNKCDELQGKVIKFVIQGFDSVLYILVLKGGLEVMTEYEHEVDVVFSGLPSGYISLSKNANLALENDDISIKGDFVVGKQFNNLIGLIEPNIERLFAKLIGDDLANHFATNHKKAKAENNTFIDFKQRQWKYILQDWLDILPLKHEIITFNGDVNKIHTDLNKLKKRIIRLTHV